MRAWQFVDDSGAFVMKDPESSTGLYLPLVNEAGMMSSTTPDLRGDAKSGQNSFALVPVSAEDLHDNRYSRNWWVAQDGEKPWSATGLSLRQKATRFDEPSDDKDEVVLRAGPLWQEVERVNRAAGLGAITRIFVPQDNRKAEIIELRLRNTGPKTKRITVTVAIPVFGRSAESIRDHRHVTSLLNRIRVVEFGQVLTPTMTFDERGHRQNSVSYSVWGSDPDGNPPVAHFPDTPAYIGEGGSFDWPQAVIQPDRPGLKSGARVDGYEMAGAMRFAPRDIVPGAEAVYRAVLCIDDGEPDKPAYLDPVTCTGAWERNREFWSRRSAVSFKGGDTDYDRWLRWVALQPELRRLFGCSFLPHHDYGKGGRGWRDLWQDLLALMFIFPTDVRSLLINNFAGVRLDGSNATIIGAGPGEFLADRNNIPRVWMDHGAWPFLTTRLYINQTGDVHVLLEDQVYFKDQHIGRCRAHDEKWEPSQGIRQLTEDGAIYRASILEHLLVQHLTAALHVGEHGNILLEGADWNDGLDMARTRGESVAFTSLYASNLIDLASLLRDLASAGYSTVCLSSELSPLLGKTSLKPVTPSQKRALLDSYFSSVEHRVSGRKAEFKTVDLAEVVEKHGRNLMQHIRDKEWLDSRKAQSGGAVMQGQTAEGWFNGYYDDDGNVFERLAPGDKDSGSKKAGAGGKTSPRMTLTGQVFTLMGGTADDDQAATLVQAVRNHLHDSSVGGVRLNTDPGDMMLKMGRCFAFAFGHKENGAMFSHMAVMYANALYVRGFVAEGWDILHGIFRQAMDFDRSRMYPGIPEYFDSRGRGMYPYLTGSASWYILTMITRVMGVRGESGNLLLAPRLTALQFDKQGKATVRCIFRNRKLVVSYINAKHLSWGEYKVAKVSAGPLEQSGRSDSGQQPLDWYPVAPTPGESAGSPKLAGIPVDALIQWEQLSSIPPDIEYELKIELAPLH